MSGTDATRLSMEFGGTLPVSHLQELPSYSMYVRTLRQDEGGVPYPSGPHRITAHPPFERHPAYAYRESVIKTSRARYAKKAESGT